MAAPEAISVASPKPHTFPLFPSLPLELREQIWGGALPEKIEPALYPYQKGLWASRRLVPSDTDYNHNFPDQNLLFEFHHSLLDGVEIQVPLFFVNHEARAIASSWIHDHGIKLGLSRDKTGPAFVSSYSPIRDILYIASEDWHEFLIEPLNRSWEIFETRIYSIRASCTRQIAITIPSLDIVESLIILLEMDYLNVEVLFIILDTPPDLKFADIEIVAHPRWEVAGTEGGVFRWNRSCDRFGESELDGNEALSTILGDKVFELCDKLVEHRICKFEIRFVHKVRK